MAEERKMKKDTEQKGFDNPISDIKSDKLGRQPLMQQVYAHLTDLEPNWSVRVGLIAPWGEGKTTICNWIVNQAETDDHIVVQFSPWVAKTDKELWLNLYTNLVSAFDEKGIKLEQKISTKIAQLTSKNVDLIDHVKGVNNYTNLPLSLVQTFFSISREHVESIASELGNGKRIIVIIDDLDRVEISLIPRFLLSVRDSFDLQRFSFLLPFDQEVLSHALSEYGGTIEYGNDFLDKVLDYRVSIPSAPNPNIIKLFQSELNEYCSFIKLVDIEVLEKSLPQNPRKLKALVRGLRIYKKEAERHREGEIEWLAVILGQMLKVESEYFFQLYNKDTFYRSDKVSMHDTSSIDPWFRATMDNVMGVDRKGEGEKKEINRIQGLLKKSRIKNKQKKARITNLCELLRKTYDFNKHKVRYAFKLIDNPEILTWGEFDSAWDQWLFSKDLEKLGKTLSRLADNMDVPEEFMVSEFIDALSKKYWELLKHASEVPLESEHKNIIAHAKNIITVLDSLIECGIPNIEKSSTISVQNFEKIVNQIIQFYHFNGNHEDKILRKEEEKLLKKWVEMAKNKGMAFEFRDYLKKLTNLSIISERKEKPTEELCLNLQQLVEYSNCLYVEEHFRKPNGIRGIIPNDAGADIKDLVLDSKSEFWKDGDENSLGIQVLKNAEHDPVIQKNALHCIILIQTASKEGSRGFQPEEVKEIYKATGVIKALWNAAIATPLQYRRLSETRAMRDYLIKMRIDEQHLSYPNWLKAGIERDQNPYTS